MPHTWNHGASGFEVRSCNDILVIAKCIVPSAMMRCRMRPLASKPKGRRLNHCDVVPDYPQSATDRIQRFRQNVLSYTNNFSERAGTRFGVGAVGIKK